MAGAHLRYSRPAEEIASLSKELGAGLLVVGSRGLGTIARLVLGSVSEEVVYLAPCPTLLIRGTTRAWLPTRVIVGDDSSNESERAAEVATSIGRPFEAEVLLVRVGCPGSRLPSPEDPWQSWRTQRERDVVEQAQKSRRIRKALED